MGSQAKTRLYIKERERDRKGDAKGARKVNSETLRREDREKGTKDTNKFGKHPDLSLRRHLKT